MFLNSSRRNHSMNPPSTPIIYLSTLHSASHRFSAEIDEPAEIQHSERILPDCVLIDSNVDNMKLVHHMLKEPYSNDPEDTLPPLDQRLADMVDYTIQITLMSNALREQHQQHSPQLRPQYSQSTAPYFDAPDNPLHRSV